MTYRIIVSGGRDWPRVELLESTLEQLVRYHNSIDILIIHGACYPKRLPDKTWPLISADYLTERWARRNRIKTDPRPANWKVYGNGAGPIRNEQMAKDGADLCTVFWNGISTGTKNMLDNAVKYGIRTHVVSINEK